MSETPQILTYTRGDHSALCTFMSELQDLEREWSNDRAPGPEMAADHIDYLLDLAQRSDGQAFVAKLDDQLVGFIIVRAISSIRGGYGSLCCRRGKTSRHWRKPDQRRRGTRAPSGTKPPPDHDTDEEPSRSKSLYAPRLRGLHSHYV